MPIGVWHPLFTSSYFFGKVIEVEVEVEGVGNQPFKVATGSVEARYYDQEFSLIKFTSRRKDGVLRKAYMDLKGFVEI